MQAIKSYVRKSLFYVQKFCSRHASLANVYFVFDQSFALEHAAVLQGCTRYQEGIVSDAGRSHLVRLRRNIHRLEKGLIHDPRKSCFGEEYIFETVNSYSILTRTASDQVSDRETVRWAEDVLDTYFDAIAGDCDSKVETARALYCDSRVGLSRSDENSPTAISAPYLRDALKSKMTLEDLAELSHRRRSVRWFLDKAVPRKMIDNAVNIALQSPSACNRQPFKLLIFDDRAMVKELSSIPMGTRGFDHQFPVFVVIVGDLSAYPFPRDRHVIYIDASLAAMAFQFALEVQGLSSCSINWPDIPRLERRMSETLGLATEERVVMCMALGYPDPHKLVPYSQKKPLHEMRKYNKL